MSEPRWLSVQVWANPDGDGFTGYAPEAGAEVSAPTFEGARAAALEAARTAQEGSVNSTPQASDWTCICGRNNPPGRTNCSGCGSPRF